jgi:hypothetical protein
VRERDEADTRRPQLHAETRVCTFDHTSLLLNRSFTTAQDTCAADAHSLASNSLRSSPHVFGSLVAAST